MSTLVPDPNVVNEKLGISFEVGEVLTFFVYGVFK